MKDRNARFTTILLVVACFALPNIAKAGQTPSNVNVVNTPDVNVVNTQTAPAFVRDVDNGARQPFTVTGTSFVWGNGISDAPINITTVREGKRLVVEQVSVTAIMEPVPNQKVFAWIETTNGTTVFRYYFGGNDLGGDPQEFVGSSQLKSYADGGTVVRMVTHRTTAMGAGRVDVTLSGYLIDLP